MLIIIIRSVLLYILIVFALRLMGKKQLAQLQPSELLFISLLTSEQLILRFAASLLSPLFMLSTDFSDKSGSFFELLI